MVNSLEVRNLNYQDFTNINMEFEEGKYYVILGANNSGKTTLFKLLTSLVMTHNTLFYKNKSVSWYNHFDYLKYIGIVKKVHRKSFFCKSVKDEMLYPLINLGYSYDTSLKRIKYILSLFHEEDLLNKYINQLSFRKKQKLLIMIALLHRPSILFLDDVLSVFNSTERDEIISIIQKSRLTLINMTSNTEEILLSDEVIILDNFKIKNIVTKEDILKDDSILLNANLELPFLYDLNNKLKMYDLLKEDCHNVKEMVNAIWD